MMRIEGIRAGQQLRVVNQTRSTLVARELMLALDFLGRTRGLLGRPPLADGQGLLLRPCRGVHTFFMGYAIDVAFLDPAGRVVELRSGLRPWRMTPLVPEALCVLELPENRLASSGTKLGDQLAFELAAIV
jgi:uncharacterized membrane protein (UPF0127 family)